MNAIQPTWLPALRKLLTALCSPQPGREGLTQLVASIADLDALLVQNRAEMPSELIHFLERRSYDKAARYCEGNMSIPRGNCGTKVLQ
jgi:hypothetical protein